MRQVARPRFSTLSAGHTCSRPQKAADDIQRLVEMVKKRQYDPLIVFSFSKKECEAHATATHTLDINTGAERVPAERACPGTCNMECELHLHNVQETPKVHTHTHTHTLSLSLSSLPPPDEEKANIEKIFRAAIDSLSDDDQRLPQVRAACVHCSMVRHLFPARHGKARQGMALNMALSARPVGVRTACR